MRETAVVLVGHGSRFPDFDSPLKKIRRTLLKEARFKEVRLAYLEINSPSIPEAVRRCVENGAKQVNILPYFVLGGNHVEKHIPKIVADIQKEHKKNARIFLCSYLGFHEKIAEVVKERLRCR